LSGGAHVLFPGSETTIAVKMYYPEQLNHLELSSPKTDLIESWNRGKIPMRGNMDDLKIFRDAFKYPVVFFILPPSPLMEQQLSRSDSFFHLTQVVMNDAQRDGNIERNPKTFLVPTTKAVIETVLIMIDALQPERRKLRDDYFTYTRALNFLPDVKGHIDQSLIARQVADKVHKLSIHLGFAPGEAEILMNHLGCLHKIATADYQDLRGIPIHDSSKNKLQEFFGSQRDQGETSCVMWHDGSEVEECNHAYLSEHPEHYHFQENELHGASGHHQQRDMPQSLPMAYARDDIACQQNFPEKPYENCHSDYLTRRTIHKSYESIPIQREICERSFRNEIGFGLDNNIHSNVQSSYGYPEPYQSHQRCNSRAVNSRLHTGQRHTIGSNNYFH